MPRRGGRQARGFSQAAQSIPSRIEYYGRYTPKRFKHRKIQATQFLRRLARDSRFWVASEDGER
jgi:hypothetical protein